MSQGLFKEVSNVPTKYVGKIFSDIENILYDIETINPTTLRCLGSAASVIENRISREYIGDVDLVCMAATSTVDSSDCKIVSDHFSELGFEAKSFFGNIVSVKYPLNGNFYQVDIILSPASLECYDYIVELKFKSEEYRENIKGLHRTELIRFVCKTVGLSMSNYCLIEYQWNSNIKSFHDVIRVLEEKLKRTRKKENRDSICFILNSLMDFHKIDDFKKTLCDNFDCLSNRYRIGIYDELEIEFIRELFFSPVKLTDEHWDNIIQSKFNILSVPNRLKTLDDVITWILDLLRYEKISYSMFIRAFFSYKSHLTEKGLYSSDLDKFFENSLNMRLS